jgi:hypothetical protein
VFPLLAVREIKIYSRPAHYFQTRMDRFPDGAWQARDFFSSLVEYQWLLFIY